MNDYKALWTRKVNVWKKLTALAALLCASGIANAVPMTWSYSGTGSCTVGCSGAVNVSGTITGNPTILNSSLLSGFELSTWSFAISGAISESYSGVFALGDYSLGAGGAITGGSMVFGDLFQLEFLNAGATTWSFTDYAWYITPTWNQVTRSASGNGGYNQVREPGSLALLGGGLLVLGLMRRRRKNS